MNHEIKRAVTWLRSWENPGSEAEHAADAIEKLQQMYGAACLRLQALGEKEVSLVLPEAAPLIGWIAVKDRLPNDDSTVLIAMKDGDETVWLGYYDGDCWYSVDATPIRTRVTHWAPKPSPPMNK